MKALANNREIIFPYYYFLNIVFFYQLFLLYLPIAEKFLVLFFSNLRSYETRFFYPRKVPNDVVAWILHVQKIDMLLLLVTDSAAEEGLVYSRCRIR